MRLVIVSLYSVVFMTACGGVEGDPSTLLAENTEGAHVRDDMPAENGLNLIATLSLDNGNTLEFYEPFPGTVLISEVGMLSNPPVSTTHDLRSKSPVEIYQTLAPKRTVPAALTAAQHRSDERVALENVTAAETDVQPFVNRDDVAMNHDANQDDGTQTDVQPFVNRDDVAMNHDANQDDGTQDDKSTGCTARWIQNLCWNKPPEVQHFACLPYQHQEKTISGHGAGWAKVAVCLERGTALWRFYYTAYGNPKKWLLEGKLLQYPGQWRSFYNGRVDAKFPRFSIRHEVKPWPSAYYHMYTEWRNSEFR